MGNTTPKAPSEPKPQSAPRPEPRLPSPSTPITRTKPVGEISRKV